MSTESTEWEVIYESSTDYESDIVRDRLDSAGIPAIVDTKRDHSFHVNVGDLARVFVMVPVTHADQARAVLASEPFTDAELAQAALAADPDAPPAHNPEDEAMLDSGMERIRLRAPEDDPDSDK